MVGSLLLLKMLHCKRRKDKQREASGEGTSKQAAYHEVNVKTEQQSLDKTCRICLKEGSRPIFDGSSDGIRESLSTIGGIDVRADDPFPKFLCQACHALLQGAILFRKTALRSDKFIKKQELLRAAEAAKQESISNDDPTSEGLGDEFEIEMKYDIQDIVKKAEKKTKTSLECKRCELQFDSYKDYSDHRMEDTCEKKRITCKDCNKDFDASYYRKHILIHKGDVTHMCDICGKKFFLQGHFARHRLTHFYELPYQCSLCPYRGRFTESLKMHMRSHTGEKPYQCELCPSRFINKSNLNKHTLTHKKKMDFRCEMCGKGFYTKRELELHLKVDHTGIREHVCSICGKAFGYQKQLRKHELKVHKREKQRSGRMPLYLKVQSMKQTVDEKVDES